MYKVYHYPGCSTCKKALKYLDSKGIVYTPIDISEKAPGRGELKKMLALYNGEIRKLFNTSGKLYRELELSKRLPDMSQSEALALLADNGMLVKRPFLLSSSGGFVGYKETEWAKLSR